MRIEVILGYSIALIPAEASIMPCPAETKVAELRARFEGKEAIYIEQGAVRVRVSDICWDACILGITAKVEEIATAGFPVGVFYESQRDESNPLFWNIGAGYLTTFSEHTWRTGNGGWCIFFSPEIVDGLVGLAREFPEDLHPFGGYREVLKYLDDHNAHEPAERVFSVG
jgi:hypothetical protein